MKFGREFRGGSMIYLDENKTRALITHELAYTAVKSAYKTLAKGQVTLFPVVNAEGSQQGSMFSLKSASTSRLVGWKTGTYWPENKIQDIPCHGSHIFLLSPETGELSAVVSASQVNAYRTAAADAVAVDFLATKNASTLTVFGTGHQAEFEVMAVIAKRPINRVIVVGRNRDKSEKFVERLAQQGVTRKVTIEIESAKYGCENADIIITATTATEPLFKAEWVKAGTHISAMGADKVGKQELPVELYRRSKLFCDYQPQSVVIGEFQHADKPVITEIGLVILGRSKGRIDNMDITIFDSSGIAIQDLSVAAKLLELI